MMEALKVNGDYEQELFFGKKGPRIINESLEFLAFYLSDAPVISSKTYTPQYLDHVEALIGRRPQIIAKGNSRNWWGPLTDLKHERWMNSKLTSAELIRKLEWNSEVVIVSDRAQLEKLTVTKTLLVKDPFGMSGKGIREIRNADDLTTIRNFPCILEPFRKRMWDFSHYVWPSGTAIAYQNLVDNNFQYRGSLFRDLKDPSVKQLSFYKRVPDQEWERFHQALASIQHHFDNHLHDSGYSIDSFIYEESESMKIQNLCEVNYRRTLGSTAFEIGKMLAKQGPWCMFVLGKTVASDFKWLRSRAEQLPGVVLLSPDDVRFQMFLLSAPDEKEGKEIFKRLKTLLPECQFSVNIEDEFAGFLDG